MRLRMIVLVGICVMLGWAAAAEAAGPRVILALGNASFIDAQAILKATGAEVTQDPGKALLKDVAVLVLADVPFGSLPQPVQGGLVEYVNSGGAVLITGGAQSFGSGGYKEVAPIIPFEIRSDNDWRAVPFRSPVPLQPGHPILAGILGPGFITIGTLNDMNPRPGATEILRSPGGASSTGGASYPSPLIAELGVGAGRVVGVAFDPNRLGGWGLRDLFVRNTLDYLLTSSRLGR
ncbi:MAG TPA: hypothetical protein VF579_03925 [Candidatus Methylomirabilis sp.]